MIKDKFQIVVVDDSEEILNLYKEFLSDLDHEIICFADPLEAKDHIKNDAQNILLLILDYSLPEMTGLELRSQTMQAAGDIPAVIVTGFYDEKMAIEGMKQKVQAFISKPFEQEEILNAINEYSAPRLSFLNEELEMKESFVEESFPMVEEIEDLILVLEDDPENETALNTYFRLLHTIKGTASCVGLNVIANYVHYYEELVSDLKAQKTKVNKAVIDVLLEGLDRVKEMYRSISEREELSFDPSVEVAIFQKDFTKSEQADSNVVSLEQDSPRASTYKKSSKKSDDEKIQVSVEILDQFMELSGELTVLRNTIIKNSVKIDNKYPGDRDVDTLKDSLEEMYKVSSTLQQSISEMRKVGADTVLRPLKRIVRDATKHLNKDVEFETSGEEIRLDTSLSKILSNVLVHMVRNGVDHGIEAPDSRKNIGKNPQGRLSVDLRLDGDMVLIDLKDDGKGLDVNVLKKKALEKRLYTKDELDKMSAQRVFHFIFESGFSTAEAVTDLSGRGVGMDMVNSSIKNIGGKIKIDSKVGEGTQFQIRAPIPRSVLIIKSLLVSSAGVKFCIPLDCISDVVNLEISDGIKIHDVSGAKMIRHHEKLIPYVSLRETLLIDDTNTKEGSIVFLVHEGHHYGVAVDEIFEIEEVVAKKLASKIDKDQLFVGATVLGEGEVGYILSVEGVALRAGIQKNISVEDFGETPMEIDSGYQDFMQLEFKQKGLYAVEIDYVHRLEIFSKERIEYTGSKPFVRYQNRPMPLLFIDKMQEKFESDLSVIVLRYDGKLYGLVVSHIKDIGQTQDEIDVSMADDRMIKGTVFINEKTVSIIDLEKVLSESINLNEISDKEKVAA